MLREAHLSIPILQRRSTMAPFLQPSRSACSAVWPAASSHQQAFLFSLSRNATRLNQDDVADLAAESAFDYDPLEKRMLLGAAACECTLQMQHTCSSGRACHLHAFCACGLPLSGARLCPKGRSAPRLS